MTESWNQTLVSRANCQNVMDAKQNTKKRR